MTETALALRDQGTQLAAITPTQRVMANVDMVKALSAVVRKQYVVRIQNKDYLTVAGCQVIGSGLGFTTGTTELVYVPGNGPIPGCWRATVAVYDTATGRTVGQGVASVFDDERPWNTRPQFARQGMAQTRATGRALKGVMGYAFALVGVEQSFAEEMPEEATERRQETSEPARRLPAPSTTERALQGKAAVSQTHVAVVATVDEKTSKAGKPYWRVECEFGDRTEWFTSFKPVAAACVGRRMTLVMGTTAKGDPVINDIYEAVDPEEVPF